jgi:hypothetical protein
VSRRIAQSPRRVVATACTQGKRTHHGKPHGVVDDGQPDSREGRSRRFGVTERPVVPLKPGNAGGGKGPWFRTDAASSEGQEIGQPINSEECSEAADGVTRESEDRSRVSLLRSVRQDIPRGHPDACLCAVPRTRAHRVWTARTLRISRRRALTSDKANGITASPRQHRAHRYASCSHDAVRHVEFFGEWTSDQLERRQKLWIGSRQTLQLVDE